MPQARAEAERERRRRGASVLALLRLPLRHGHRLPVQRHAAVAGAYERVLEERRVVALRVVIRPSVCAAALLACKTRDHHALGQLEQKAELERLREIAVE